MHRGDPALPALGDEELLAELGESYDAVPPELREDPEWFALLLAGLRADLRIVADYRRSAPADPLPVPLTVLGGTDDPDVTRDDLAAWAPYSTEPLRLRMYPGRHFYFREQEHDVHHHLTADLDRAAR
ncbi:hypothetical protein GXW82_26110 [Streptacidiphilus sp. 4-A2]|nr:hypothetical protein [Streptacidiphilus sp. 4-A2]